MNKFKIMAWRVFWAALIIAIGGWILAFVLNLVSFIASPAMVARFECPAGSTIKSKFSQQSYDLPGQVSYSFECLDKNGQDVSPLPDNQVTAAEYRFFYTLSLIIMTVVVFAWYVVRAVRKTETAKAG